MAINPIAGCNNASHITASTIKNIKFGVLNGEYFCDVVFKVICPICIEMGYIETGTIRNIITKDIYDSWMKADGNIINNEKVEKQ